MSRGGSQPRTAQQVIDHITRNVIVDERGCWVWMRSLSENGYSQFAWQSPYGFVTSGHRASYLVHRGTIAPGLHIDHLCRNRACVNPDHLEPVTPRENTFRSPVAPAALNFLKEFCANGHEFDEVNTYWYTRPNRVPERACKECRRENVRRNRAKVRAA